MSNVGSRTERGNPLVALYCVGVPLIFLIILVIPASRLLFEELTSAHPLISGFVKFALLSTAGEMLAGAMTTRRFSVPYAVVARMLVWGLLGVVMTIVFKLFGAGVGALLAIGYLPGGDHFFLNALWTSICMNMIFAPVMMGGHRLFDSWLDLKEVKQTTTLAAAIRHMDWNRYVTFVLAKTIPLFWIPAHTVTFLLPESYRVMLAAFLSIALGAILALAAGTGQSNQRQIA